jgi:hypothetical protein
MYMAELALHLGLIALESSSRGALQRGPQRLVAGISAGGLGNDGEGGAVRHCHKSMCKPGVDQARCTSTPYPQAELSVLQGGLVEASQLQGSNTFFVAIVMMAPSTLQVSRAGFTGMR